MSYAKQSKSSTKTGQQLQSGPKQLPAEPTFGDVAEQTMETIHQYAKRRPDVLALWCLGIGFVLGWKLKPW